MTDFAFTSKQIKYLSSIERIVTFWLHVIACITATCVLIKVYVTPVCPPRTIPTSTMYVIVLYTCTECTHPWG